MLVRFWGTRGSIASPGPQTNYYGGNTSCVSIRTADGALIVLDCGTGVRALGEYLLRTEPKPIRLHLFIGHSHWDHIQGFPFFSPVFIPDTDINVYAPGGFQRSLEATLAGQMQYSYFPVKLHEVRSRIHFTDLEEGFLRVGDVLVETQHLNHTAPTIGYRITCDGATIVYAADHEPFWPPTGQAFRHPGDQRHIDFLRDADLVIHDAQYGEEEYEAKRGWGHSPVEYATDVALAAGARQLLLYHHDPTHDDDQVARLEARAQRRALDAGGALSVRAAAEGLEIDVQGSGRAATLAASSALQRRPIAGGRVLAVGANEQEIAAIARVLEEDELILQSVPDGRAAAAEAAVIQPDLVLLDARLPDGDGAAVIPELRARSGRPDLPVLLLVGERDFDTVRRSIETGATDVFATPFSPPMLRARVQAWLARGRAGRTAHQITPDPRHDGDRPAPEADLVQVLAGLGPFRRFTAEQLQVFAGQVRRHTYRPGEPIVREGDPSDNLYVVLSGRVRVVEAIPDAPQMDMPLGELGPGEIFGEMGILVRRARSASVLAAERTECLSLSQEAFLEAVKIAPEFGLSLLRVLATRIYEANRLLARFAPDPLTGLSGRRSLHEHYQRIAGRVRRAGGSLLLFTLDVVHLREINDRFGYATGDEVLRTIADALIQATRSTDFVGRSGGDEFVALLEDAGIEVIEAILARIRRTLADLAPRRGLPADVQCSIGVVASTAPPASIEELLRAADEDRFNRKAQSLVSAD